VTKVEAVTIKVSEEARKALRIISALTGESIIEVVERLAKVEAQRLMQDHQK
jgi:hypothetical protein